MANKQTKKCPYLSSYGGGYIRGDQWITEKLCALISKRDGSELPDKFWNFPKWGQLFRRQVQIASSLLIMYDADVISRALKDNRLYNLRSFAAFSTTEFFSNILDEYQSNSNAEEEQNEIKLTPKSTTSIPKLSPKDNKLSRLKKLDVKTRPVQSG